MATFGKNKKNLDLDDVREELQNELKDKPLNILDLDVGKPLGYHLWTKDIHISGGDCSCFTCKGINNRGTVKKTEECLNGDMRLELPQELADKKSWERLGNCDMCNKEIYFINGSWSRCSVCSSYYFLCPDCERECPECKKNGPKKLTSELISEARKQIEECETGCNFVKFGKISESPFLGKTCQFCAKEKYVSFVHCGYCSHVFEVCLSCVDQHNCNRCGQENSVHEISKEYALEIIDGDAGRFDKNGIYLPQKVEFMSIEHKVSTCDFCSKNGGVLSVFECKKHPNDYLVLCEKCSGENEGVVCKFCEENNKKVENPYDYFMTPTEIMASDKKPSYKLAKEHEEIFKQNFKSGYYNNGISIAPQETLDGGITVSSTWNDADGVECHSDEVFLPPKNFSICQKDGEFEYISLDSAFDSRLDDMRLESISEFEKLKEDSEQIDLADDDCSTLEVRVKEALNSFLDKTIGYTEQYKTSISNEVISKLSGVDYPSDKEILDNIIDVLNSHIVATPPGFYMPGGGTFQGKAAK